MDIESFFRDFENVTVAVSGGVDSAVLLCMAKKYAKNVKACFVKSEFQPAFEAEDAAEICRVAGVELKTIHLSVLNAENIAANPVNRCYYCKKKIFEAVCAYAEKKNSQVIEGTNADDDIDDRPGYKAIMEMGVLSPLRICQINKAQIREIAAQNGLPVHSKPSYACLATRIPSGTPITRELLNITESSEQALFSLGFSDFRIRYDGGGALLELTARDRERYASQKSLIDNILKKYYNKVTLGRKVR